MPMYRAPAYLLRGRPRARTLRSSVLRVLVPRLLVFGAGAVVLGLGQVMAVAVTAHSSDAAADQVVAHTPAWTVTDAAAYPGCVPSSTWPAGRPAADVVVHDFGDGSHRLMAFDAAWRANHDDTEADDVWVLGFCG